MALKHDDYCLGSYLKELKELAPIATKLIFSPVIHNEFTCMHDDNRQANFTTKPRFENAGCKFNCEQIPQAAN